MTDLITQLGPLAGATRFRRISEMLYADGDKLYESLGFAFKASWFPVFYALASGTKPQTILELAGSIGYTHIHVRNILLELEAGGLVSIKIHPTDKRARQISLTAKGRKRFEQLREVWIPFTKALKQVLDAGHPDILNSLGRIEQALIHKPLQERITKPEAPEPVVVDYRPSLKKYFYKLAGPWLLGVLDGQLEDEDRFTLRHPDKAYLAEGGFVFFAVYQGRPVGCVALKRLDDQRFEFAKLFVDPMARKLGVATLLIQRCITRCRENGATQLWLQTTMRMPEAHRLYDKLGFLDKKAPKAMTVLQRTEKIMVLPLA
ncbi:bifunctional helix-turn-helix transcriptional regulator/GNAT family N-acetyltransferase [Taibaiella helva]|uniref:bifunctional helix-turn-helix transcriptional regulator/GNAT family N-acetyltransferase n=1 Tax=Taibaiella helva TaxID=2301235 RepID=UPI000E581F9F|nr:bifunctional helix-turn-helix transcriptional regulator/GNAT family N-acetyltransferase [Taibaiella helva]